MLQIYAPPKNISPDSPKPTHHPPFKPPPADGRRTPEKSTPTQSQANVPPTFQTFPSLRQTYPQKKYLPIVPSQRATHLSNLPQAHGKRSPEKSTPHSPKPTCHPPFKPSPAYGRRTPEKSTPHSPKPTHHPPFERPPAYGKCSPEKSTPTQPQANTPPTIQTSPSRRQTYPRKNISR